MSECRQSQPIIIQPILSRNHNNGRVERGTDLSTLRRLPSGNNRIRTWTESTCDITFFGDTSEPVSMTGHKTFQTALDGHQLCNEKCIYLWHMHWLDKAFQPSL